MNRKSAQGASPDKRLGGSMGRRCSLSEAEDDPDTNRMQWLPPVGSPAELPKDDVPEGALCHVQAPENEEGVWKFQGGHWNKVSRR